MLRLLRWCRPFTRSVRRRTAGLQGDSRRFVPYNGGLGRAQLEWLDQELHEATVASERVVISSHILLDPRAGDGTCFPPAVEQE